MGGKVRIEEVVDVAGPAIGAIAQVLRDGHPCAVAVSFGKDSSCLMELALEAARRVREEGFEPKLISMSGDTGVENPEMVGLMRREIEKVKRYADGCGVDIEVHVVTPALRESFQVSVLGGRSLPSFAGSKAECSVSWKVEPMTKLVSAIRKRHAAGKEIVVLTGSRFSESEARGEKMRGRGECAGKPVRNSNGQLILAAIADWTTDQVWEVLGYCSSGLVRCYSDHQDTIELYAAAGGQSCAVVADMVSEGRKSAGGCGARTGCFVCTQVTEDRSLNEMVKSERFGYMGGLGRLRNYIAATRWNWLKRHWIGRPVVDGFVKVGPGTYSGSELLELTRYCLSLDQAEADEAKRMDIEPRFQILSFEQMVVLDCLWSMEGMLPAFTAMMEWVKIREKRTHTYKVPEIVAMPARKMPETRYIFLGREWDTDDLALGVGLEDWVGESLGEFSGSGCMGRTRLRSGSTVMDVNTSSSMAVDMESAWLALDLDLDVMKQKHMACVAGASSWTAGYRWWLQRGAVAVSPGSRGKLDEVLRRTVYKERLGLAGAIDLQKVLKRTVSESERMGNVAGWTASQQRQLELV